MSGKIGRSGRRKARVLPMPHVPAAPWGALDADPVPPELTDARAQDEWQRLAPRLIASGQVTMADRTLLVAYCLKYGQWLQLEEAARRHPPIVKGSSGNPISNPATRLANQVLEILMRAASELGITPVTRGRVVRVPAPAAPSKWSDVLP